MHSMCLLWCKHTFSSAFLRSFAPLYFQHMHTGLAVPLSTNKHEEFPPMPPQHTENPIAREVQGIAKSTLSALLAARQAHPPPHAVRMITWNTGNSMGP